jgi:hypothetical protein
MTQRKEHNWNDWDYENRRTPVRVMMLTSASCCRHVQQDPACSFSVRQDNSCAKTYAPCWAHDSLKSWIHFLFLLLRNLSHMYIKICSSLDDVLSSTREDVMRRRHVLLWCADSSLNHDWSKTESFMSCLDACLGADDVRPPLEAVWV